MEAGTRNAREEKRGPAAVTRQAASFSAGGRSTLAEVSDAPLTDTIVSLVRIWAKGDRTALEAGRLLERVAAALLE